VELARQIDVAVDNDVVLKAVSYGIADSLWLRTETAPHVGALGAARYVITNAIDRSPTLTRKPAARQALEDFLRVAETLEPTERELALAAELEVTAQMRGLAVDVGESQLTAIVAERGIVALETGDKRAISALEQMLDACEFIGPLRGKVRCLEQIVLNLISSDEAYAGIADLVCAEPDVDTAMSICFGCYSSPAAPRESALEALDSYIATLREDAPRLLAP
jgi:hypothetical protein